MMQTTIGLYDIMSQDDDDHYSCHTGLQLNVPLGLYNKLELQAAVDGMNVSDYVLSMLEWIESEGLLPADDGSDLETTNDRLVKKEKDLKDEVDRKILLAVDAKAKEVRDAIEREYIENNDKMINRKSLPVFENNADILRIRQFGKTVDVDFDFLLKKK